ncbi:MAG: hypothetical protein NVS4B3_18870 [Gemmatimonadaceae bacterium]
MAPSAFPRRHKPRSSATSVAWRRLALAASIVVLGSSCDKAKELAASATDAVGKPKAAEPAAADRLDLSSKPDILFEIFGEKDDPRMIPIASIVHHELRPIVLTSSGWKQFDALYARSGATYPIYRGGVRVGTARVKQGMWEKEGAPLYSLPNCARLIPLSAVAVTGDVGTGFTVELLASTASLARRAKPTLPASAQQTKTAREMGIRLGLAAGIPQNELDALQFRAAALPTGAASGPTLLVSFIDPHAEEKVAANASTANVFVLADQDPSGTYQPSFSHIAHGPASKAEFRRFIDRLDVAGDEKDEIILEGWQYGGDTFLSVLSFVNDKWSELYRARASWCLDAKEGE